MYLYAVNFVDDSGGAVCYNAVKCAGRCNSLRNLFNSDRKWVRALGRVGDVVFLSIFWLLCSIPLVSLAAASAALYDSSNKALRKKDEHSWQSYFASFKSNFKPGIVPSLLYLLVFAGLALLLYSVRYSFYMGKVQAFVYYAVLIFSTAAFGILSIMFPMLSRFENSLPALLRNTLLLGCGNMLRSIALGALNICALLLCVNYFFPIYFLPALTALASSYLIEPMFKPYMPSEEEEE